MRRVALMLAIVLAVTGCTGKPHEPEPKYGDAAIAAVADRLKLAFEHAPLDARLTLPDDYQPMDFYQFVANYQAAFGGSWINTLQKQDLEVGWPGDLRLLTRVRGDSPQEFPTTCPQFNLGQSVVGPASKSIFYCVNDRMSVPGPIHYPQGTLWVPIDALVAQWQAAKAVGPSIATKGQQVAQAAFVYLTAMWGDALSRQIRAYAGQWNLHLPVMEEADAALKFGYCIAGAMGWAVFGEGDGTVVPLAVNITFSSHLQTTGGVGGDPVLSSYRAALQLGFAGHSVGACVGDLWVRKDALAS